MMNTMRMNELLSTKPSLMRKIHFYIIPLGKGMHHRSTLGISNRLIRPVPSRTAAGSSSSGSRRVRPARAAVFKMADQTRTAKHRNSGGIVRDLEVQIDNGLVPVDLHVLDIKLNWNSSLLLGRAFLSTVGAVCNLQTNQLCLTLINPNAHYDPIPVKKPQMSSRRINDPGIIAACHCGVEYETKYSASIETRTATSIDSGNQKWTDNSQDESVDRRPDDWENDYYNPTIAAYTRQNMHTEEYDEDYEDERATE
ncbi:hypothetical protein F2Q70_00012306 [Brassica cretica]|uniref:Uncharacterized protein n=1 Tax=Brassica cretica TaxID=69181 RepID=A0A8S9M531_BRACR|nr:hypothetical protein F2Q70_00012306 [Brassica cretica]